VPDPPGKVLPSSKVVINGRDVMKLPEREMKRIRGSEIAMIFQDPMTALNPVFTVGNQLSEVLMRHQGLSKERARARCVELLEHVGIPAPSKRVDAYPHQLSGGMRQRAMIAMALSCSPKILIADEPTTALDVTIQAQILELIKKLQRETGMAVILITHDLGVVAETCDRVNEAGRGAERKPLYAIPGMVPDIHRLPAGCRFAERCFRAEGRCRSEDPALTAMGAGRRAACLFPLEAGVHAATAADA
jgi:ABC-type dipeptide/oligopeptide/nickel transport system ATPase component